MLLRRTRPLAIEIWKKQSGLSSPTFRIGDLLNESKSTQNIVIQGWVRHTQRLGKILFLKLNDGSSPHQIQVVVPKAVCHTVPVGSAVRFYGHWVPSQGKQQRMEFLADNCLFVGEPSEFNPEGGDNESLRLVPHLRPKTLEFASILRMRSRLHFLMHKFFSDKSFLHIDTPIFSQNDCEDAGEAFSAVCSEVDFFRNTQAFLPVSAQLHLEAMSSSLGNVYTIAPCFRANRSQTRQHLAEFRMLEVECAFMDSLEGICTLVEEFFRFLIEKTLPEFQNGDFEESAPLCLRNTTNDDEREFAASSQILADCMQKFKDTPLQRITFLEAMEILNSRGREGDPRNGLNKKDEFDLINIFEGPLFVTHFPSDQKPFYMRRTEDGKFTESFDLLAPFVGEVAGGSLREWDQELLLERLPKQAKREKLDWYVQLRRYGYPKSAGFGLGVDRLMQSLFGIVNIKDTIPFPRCSNHTIKC